MVFQWIASFKDGSRTSIKDTPRSGWLLERKEEKVQLIEDAIRNDAHLHLSDISEITGVPKETARLILTKELQMTKVQSIWVPYLLSQENKRQRLQCAQAFLMLYQSEGEQSVLHKVVTVDETWMCFSSNPWRNETR